MENEIINLELCKTYLRIDHNTDDALLKSIISAVITHTEDYLKLDIKRRNHILTHYDFTGHKIAPSHANELTVNSIFYQLYNDSPLQKFEAFAVNNNVIYMSEMVHIKKMIVNYDSGYEQVPEPIKIGMLEHIASIYDGNPNNCFLPEQSKAFYHPYRHITL